MITTNEIKIALWVDLCVCIPIVQCVVFSGCSMKNLVTNGNLRFFFKIYLGFPLLFCFFSSLLHPNTMNDVRRRIKYVFSVCMCVFVGKKKIWVCEACGGTRKQKITIMINIKRQQSKNWWTHKFVDCCFVEWWVPVLYGETIFFLFFKSTDEWTK